MARMIMSDIQETFPTRGHDIPGFYLEQTLRPRVTFDYNGEVRGAAIIAPLDDPHFFEEMEAFVIEALQIKALRKNKTENVKNRKERISAEVLRIKGLRDQNKIDETTYLALIRARRGQGRFRQGVLQLHSYRCAATELEETTLLIAGHLKPWYLCNDEEKLDPYNGLALSPTLDRLVDKGLLAFDDEGRAHVSSKLRKQTAKLLGLEEIMIKPDKAHLPYLTWHRNQIFQA